MNTRRAQALRALVAVSAVLLALDLAVWASGESPARVLRLALTGSLGSAYGIAQSLAKATPLVWTGAAVAFALRARLFNNGAEGQCMSGVLAAAVVGAALPATTPWLIAVPAALLATVGLERRLVAFTTGTADAVLTAAHGHPAPARTRARIRTRAHARRNRSAPPQPKRAATPAKRSRLRSWSPQNRRHRCEAPAATKADR